MLSSIESFLFSSFPSLPFLFFETFLKREISGLQPNRQEGIEIAPHTCIASPIINLSHEGGTFVPTDIDTSYHPMSLVYLRVHSWWCSLYRFGQMYSDIIMLSVRVFSLP